MRIHTEGERTSSRPVASSQAGGIVLVAVLPALGAFLLAQSIRHPAFWWAACSSLLPMFLAVKLLRPVGGAIAGASWGGWVFLLCSTPAGGFPRPGLLSLTLLTVLPALFGFLGSLLVRRRGFDPLVLALGWTGLEICLVHLGLPNGLTVGTADSTPSLQLLAQELGSVFVAFFIALANAAQVAVLARVARSTRPAARSGRVPRGHDRRVLRVSVTPQLLLWSDRRSRAPPITSLSS